jgi:hypothetical protein
MPEILMSEHVSEKRPEPEQKVVSTYRQSHVLQKLQVRKVAYYIDSEKNGDIDHNDLCENTLSLEIVFNIPEKIHT